MPRDSHMNKMQRLGGRSSVGHVREHNSTAQVGAKRGGVKDACRYERHAAGLRQPLRAFQRIPVARNHQEYKTKPRRSAACRMQSSKWYARPAGLA